MNDNDSGNVVKLNPKVMDDVSDSHLVCVCKNCECIDFNLVKTQDGIVYIFCAECDEQY